MIRLAKEALNNIEDGDLEHKYRTEQGLTLEAAVARAIDYVRQAIASAPGMSSVPAR